MFRIECFCDDAKLAKIKWLLLGHVYNLTDEPVVNAVKKGGRVQAKARDVLEMFANYLQAGNVKEVTPRIAKEFSDTLGKGNNYYSNLLRKAIAAGMLKRIGNDYRYQILSQRPAAAKHKRAAVKRGKVKRAKTKRLSKRLAKKTLKQETA
jgi:hypothetical protein